MISKHDLRQLKLEAAYSYTDCSVCGGSRKLEVISDGELNIIQCPECGKVMVFRSLLYNSNIPIELMDENLVNFKHYNMFVATGLEFQDLVKNYVLNKIKVIANKINLYLQGGDLKYSQQIGCGVLTSYIKSGYSCKIYDGRCLVETVKGWLYSPDKYSFYSQYDKTYSYAISKPEDIWLDMFVEYNDLIFISDLDLVNLSGSVRGGLISLLNSRRSNNLITIISSNIEFREIVFSYSLTDYILVELGVRDNDYLQQDLISKIK